MVQVDVALHLVYNFGGESLLASRIKLLGLGGHNFANFVKIGRGDRGILSFLKS